MAFTLIVDALAVLHTVSVALTLRWRWFSFGFNFFAHIVLTIGIFRTFHVLTAGKTSFAFVVDFVRFVSEGAVTGPGDQGAFGMFNTAFPEQSAFGSISSDACVVEDGKMFLMAHTGHGVVVALRMFVEQVSMAVMHPAALLIYDTAVFLLGCIRQADIFISIFEFDEVFPAAALVIHADRVGNASLTLVVIVTAGVESSNADWVVDVSLFFRGVPRALLAGTHSSEKAAGGRATFRVAFILDKRTLFICLAFELVL